MLMLYVTDSLIKNLGQPAATFFEKFLISMFAKMTLRCPFEVKFKLFKLFYSWKWFVNPAVLVAIDREFAFSQFKEYIKTDHGAMLREYDDFNSRIEASLKPKFRYKENCRRKV